MKKIMKKFAAGLLLVPALAIGVGMYAPVSHVSAACDETAGIAGAVNDDCAKGTGQRTELFGESGVITNIINIMLFIVGILAVIMLIYGGIRYVISGGDQTAVTNAKNTIMYAIVGLVVAILGYALVRWVTTSLTSE